MNADAQEKPEKRSPRAGVMGSCELPNMGALKEEHVPSATEHLSSPYPSSFSGQFSGIKCIPVVCTPSPLSISVFQLPSNVTSS